MVNTERRGILCTRYLSEPIDYTGRELRSHFVRERAGIETDGVISFMGGCNVRGDDLVDLADAGAGSTIVAGKMLHFICEHFAIGLREGNLRLRLLVAVVKEAIEREGIKAAVVRNGDDLFVGGRKLSVAVCTASPVSSLMHLGVNVDPTGAPVPAIGLEELGIDPVKLARSVLERYSAECESIELALRKVRGVG
jgi:hypothetical protein